MTVRPIASLPLEGKLPLYYYPDFRLLTLDGEFHHRLTSPERFGDILFRYFLGIRKLTALKQAQDPPRSLFVEPWRTCNLACTYCYAESDPTHTRKIDGAKLSSLLTKYPFKEVSVFGGEPLLHAEFLPELYKNHEWDGFFFSTNGILLDRKPARDLIARPKVRFQISLEPQDWSCRVTANNEKQIDLLRSQLRQLKDSNPNLRVTVPPDAPYVPLANFIDGLAEAIGSWNFSISYWPARAALPVPWLKDRWLQESYELVKGDSAGRYGDKLPCSHIASYFGAPESFRFFNCNAAYGSVSIGPDNKLHGCHELAVVESELDLVSASGDAQEIDELKRSALVYKWSNLMNPRTCGGCTARLICGGVCFVMDAPNSACHFLTDYTALTLTKMVRYETAEIMSLASRSEERFERLFSQREGLDKEVNSAKWNRLVSGELPLAEAVELAGRLLKD